VGVAAGTSSIVARFSDYVYTYNGEYCDGNLSPHQGTAGVTVQEPTYVGVGSAVADTVRCGTTNYSARRLQVPYTVLDSNKSPIAVAGMTVEEQLSWTSSVCATSNDCGQEPSAGTWTTDGSGGFTDTIYNCSATCENNGSCTEDWQQTFTVNTHSVGIVNGSAVGTLNCVATDCSSTPQGVTH